MILPLQLIVLLYLIMSNHQRRGKLKKTFKGFLGPKKTKGEELRPLKERERLLKRGKKKGKKLKKGRS